MSLPYVWLLKLQSKPFLNCPGINHDPVTDFAKTKDHVTFVTISLEKTQSINHQSRTETKQVENHLIEKNSEERDQVVTVKKTICF